MSTVSVKSGGAQAPPASRFNTGSIASWLFRLGGLALIDAVAIWLVYQMFRDGVWQFGAVIALVTLLINAIFLFEDLYPLRWISPGLALLIIVVLYPILSTIYISFTNYGDGHLLTKPVAIRLIESETFLPEDAVVFDWTAYISPDGQYLLWLRAPDGSAQYIARPDTPLEPAEGEPPAEIDGYRQLNNIERLRHTAALVALTFGVPPDAFRVSDRQIGKAARYEQRYVYDPAQDVIVDQLNGKVYRPVEGTFTADDGSTLRPGFQVRIGARNFMRLFTTPSLRGPFALVFLWTVLFATLSVLLTFALGMFLAIVFDVPEMPGRNMLRSLLLIPYAIPAFISVPIWVGLLNPQFGVISQFMLNVFGWTPPWFADPIWSKLGILLIQLWLGFPYMFVIVTGALQALPKDVYEAADIDGAGAFAKFWGITLPLLMITVGPLLVASFAFNFNNFTVIYLYNLGGPPMAGTSSPVGHTDILATYTFRIAFSSGRGADLGYAAAITVVIFLILLVITFFQFRFTNMLEERSENV
ncbi:MAG: ABC transporter permease subunit [Caldilineaceae bacterium]|nr:ABC transporter permease subunit [Caldilineaceae bacterium]